MVKVVTISGFKDSGKTSVLESLVKTLSERGNEVGTIKHIPHGNYAIDQEETDTWRHVEAGSKKTIALGPEEVFTWEKKDKNLEDLLLSLRDLDYVVMEGFKNAENIVKIAVARDESEAKKLDDEFTVCFIGQGIDGKTVLDPEDTSKLADLVENKAVTPVGGLNCGDCGYDTCRDYVLAALEGKAPQEGCVALKGPTTIFVDGEQIPIKSFVKNLIANTVEGVVDSLKGTDGEEIEIRIRKNKG